MDEKRKVKKATPEALQKRKEGRLKAAATMASNLKKIGIMRVDDENNFPTTNIKSIPLINQKNYFTDYLKKDEQISFIRNWRTEKLLKQKLKKLNASGGKKIEIKNFDNFNLNEIEEEMKKKQLEMDGGKIDDVNDTVQNNDDDDEDDDDDEENEAGEGETEEVIAEKARIGGDVIVIHPGSSNFRIGKATDAVPLTIPTVVAVAQASKPEDYLPVSPEREMSKDGVADFGEDFENIKSEMTKNFKARMRFYKRRILPNSRETAANYNKRQEPELIPDHNDPHKKDWIDLEDIKDKQFLVGEEALKLPISEKFTNWKLRYPIINGKFNENKKTYSSKQEILGDLTNLVNYALDNLDIDKTKLSEYKCILIIPDLYDKMVVENFIDLLFKLVGFGRVGIIQESLAATFGAGTSSACVVDVGAQTTTVSCIDEGLVINDSRIKLNFGGDNITEVFMKMLLQQSFPYQEINLNYAYDWELAQTLKHNFITFQDADIAVQLYNFYKRRPFETTSKYEFKVFDEVMLAPLGLFYPESFTNKTNKEHNFFPPSVDQYSLKSDNPISKSQENIISGNNFTSITEESLLSKLNEETKLLKNTNPYSKAKLTNKDLNELEISFPLERAIIESITNSGLATDFEKAKKFYGNLLVVGGGLSKIPGFDLLLTDRINIWRPKILSTSNIDDIFDYIGNQEKKLDFQRRKLTNEITGGNDEVELTEEQQQEIDEKCQMTFDLDYLDSVCDNAQLIPVNVLPPPREFDPEMLTWKGGSVYGRLKVVNEMWITKKDWDLLASRCLYYKTLFNY
ncbi:actin-like protein Arp8p [[Candida] jaroonii]|uniref:Actin-like protein Arp8p n=1 Tax=[Candida] jaroonii TaxID=467808 RepID=A0ACA9YBL3_9ASCO|nr:actin-like protein Arp8p [[Candida] jaroonii]